MPRFFKDAVRLGCSLVLDLLFRPHCLLCKTATDHPHHLCPACLQQLPEQPENHCLHCGIGTSSAQAGCGLCLNAPNKTADATYFAYRYDYPMTHWIIGLKFSDRSEWSTLLGKLFWRRLKEPLRWESPDILMPIPLHPRRLLARHYNQSALLAGALAHFLHRPLVTNGLKRVKMTQPQTHLSADKRAENVRGAFRADPKKVQGRSILLVDDVFTTGSTARAAVQTLKRAGASRVVVACLAAAQPKQHANANRSPTGLITPGHTRQRPENSYHSSRRS